MKKRLIFEAVIMSLLLSVYAWGNYVGDYMIYGKLLTIKVTAGDSATALQVTGGAVKVGTGTPGTTPGQNDVYITGTLEVDGVAKFDASTMSLRGVTYTLPSADGSAGYGLTTNGSGALIWASLHLPLTAGGSALGSNLLPFSSVYIGAAGTNNANVTGTFTGARTITIPDTTGTLALADSLTPVSLGTNTVGSAAKPFGSIYIGNAATNNFQVTGTATGARTTTLPDADITVAGVRHYDAGTTTTSANTNKSATGLFYSGSVQVSAGTQVVITGISPTFTGTNTYSCVANGEGETSIWRCANTSTSSITLTAGTAVTERVAYILMGY
jgi:hypothetical protein